MNKDPNKRHYFEKVSTDEREALLAEAAREHLSIFLWEEGQTEKELEEFEILSFSTLDKVLSINKKGGLLSKLSKSRLLNKETYFKISYEGMHLLSHAVLNYDKQAQKYSLRLINEFFKGQQRTNYRLNAGRKMILKFRIDGEVFHANDISAGGTSFTIEDRLLERFQKGKAFENCAIQIHDQKFELGICKIAGIWPILDSENGPTAHSKVGVSFEGINKKVEESLCQKINIEARAEELRKKFKY